MSERDRRVAAALFVITSSVYFATAAGITSSNDGSHYALVRALADEHRFEISDYLSFTEYQDYALIDDLRFSDRPPGTAMLAAPVYALSAFLPKPLAALESKHDAANPRMLYALVIPVAAASATTIISFWILRAHFGLAEWTSVLTTLAFAFGTMTWKYGSLLYSHAASGLCVMLAVALMLRYSHPERRREAAQSKDADNSQPLAGNAPFDYGSKVHRPSAQGAFWLGLLLGASVLMEYTNIIFVAFAGAWCVGQIANLSNGRRRMFLLGLGGLMPAVFLMGYNAANFGSPFALSTFHADTTRWPQNESLFTDFATPLWVGLPAMLFYGYENQGLFWLAPISLLGLFGLKGLWQRSRREFALIAGVFAAMLLLFSTSTTFNPYTNDGRYLTPFLGLWFVAVGFGVGRMVGAIRESPLRWAIIYGLLFISIRNQIMHIAFSWGHPAPENMIALWNAVFPNALNAPLWWGVLAAGWVARRAWEEQQMGRRRRIESV